MSLRLFFLRDNLSQFVNMNAQQYVDVVNYFATLFPECVEAKTKLDTDKVLSLFHGSFTSDSKKPVSEDSMEVDCTNVTDVYVFKTNVQFFGANGILKNAKTTAQEQMHVKVAFRAHWNGSPNSFSKLVGNQVHVEHFRDGAEASSFFKNGVPISVSEILKSISMSDLLGRKEDGSAIQPEVEEMWKAFLEADKTHSCRCGAYSPVANFGQIFVQGVTFTDIQSTFPFPVGVKLNSFNANVDSGNGDLFYKNFVFIKEPEKANTFITGNGVLLKDSSTIWSCDAEALRKEFEEKTTEQENTPSGKKEKRSKFCVHSFVGPFHDQDWIEKFGGIPLELCEVEKFNHIPFPLTSGLIQIEPNVLLKHASPEHVEVFKKPFAFIPRGHALFSYFEGLHRASTDPSFNQATKKIMLFEKNLKSITYQFIKFPYITSLGKLRYNPSLNTAQAMENAAKERTENVDIGHGVVMELEKIELVASWFLAEYNEKYMFKRPMSLDEVDFVLFRANTNDNEWISYRDKEKFTEKQLNETYNFSTNISIRFSIFPFGLPCSPSHISVTE